MQYHEFTSIPPMPKQHHKVHSNCFFFSNSENSVSFPLMYLGLASPLTAVVSDFHLLLCPSPDSLTQMFIAVSLYLHLPAFLWILTCPAILNGFWNELFRWQAVRNGGRKLYDTLKFYSLVYFSCIYGTTDLWQWLQPVLKIDLLKKIKVNW